MGRLEKIRKSIGDVHNREFIARFNYALEALQGDEAALSTFSTAAFDGLKIFADQNNKPMNTFLIDLYSVYKKMNEHFSDKQKGEK